MPPHGGGGVSPAPPFASPQGHYQIPPHPQQLMMHYGPPQGMPPGQMGQGPPPQGPPMPPQTSERSSGGGNREAGPALVARLMGDQQHCSPEEWREKDHFYRKLVAFSSQHGHPLTGQPTVSKTPMDLFQLYREVQRRGGFEEVFPIFYYFFLHFFTFFDATIYGLFRPWFCLLF